MTGNFVLPVGQEHLKFILRDTNQNDYKKACLTEVIGTPKNTCKLYNQFAS